MGDIKSSYKMNNYDIVFQSICFSLNPKKIVEFGVLEGYSLDSFIKYGKNALIESNDLFDDFPHNAADCNFVMNKYQKNSNVKIYKKNFYCSVNDYENDSIDILHIDIANNGETFDFAIQNYISKVRGIMILEGGSEERDCVEWMVKYNKPKIRPILQKYSNSVIIEVLEPFPSLTLIRK
tara:strand:+ start:5904 stop:6443 length:540 start_codon:yes stop_codon:yes gene_type:complete